MRLQSNKKLSTTLATSVLLFKVSLYECVFPLDTDTGQNENARGGRARRQGGAQGNRAIEQEGGRRAEQAREMIDGGGRGGPRWMRGRGRGRGGRADLGRGGERDAVRGGGEETGGRRGGGEGVQGRGRGRRGGAEGARGGDGRRGRQRGGWPRGGNGGEGGGLGRNQVPDIGEREEARRQLPEMGVTRGGHRVDRRGGRGSERRDDAGDRRERNGGRSNFTGRVRAPQGRGLGYKTLEELSGQDPSVVAITLSSHPTLQDVLRDRVMKKDLVELLCLLMSKAFKSRTDRGTLQHLASIIKNSVFFQTILLHYIGAMGLESNPFRRAQYPQHLENILAIAYEVGNSQRKE